MRKEFNAMGYRRRTIDLTSMILKRYYRAVMAAAVESGSEGGSLSAPQSWHGAVRAIEGMGREGVDMYMTFEVYLPESRVMVIFISILDEQGFAGLPKGLYLMTDMDHAEMTSDGPWAVRRKGELIHHIARAIAGPHPKKPIVYADLPEGIKDQANLPHETVIDLLHTFILNDMNGELEGYPVYEIVPMAPSEGQQALSQAPIRYIYRPPKNE